MVYELDAQREVVDIIIKPSILEFELLQDSFHKGTEELELIMLG